VGHGLLLHQGHKIPSGPKKMLHYLLGDTKKGCSNKFLVPILCRQKSCAKTSGYISFVVKSKARPQVFLTYPPKRLYIKSNWLTPSQIVFGLPCTIWLVEFRVSIAINKCPPTRPNVSKINLHPPRKWPCLGPPCLISSKASRVKMPFSGSLASKWVEHWGLGGSYPNNLGDVNVSQGPQD